ncbi:hypothetical protein Z043_121857 [Scleropages formosus]|uniref:Uncharacterized protein n=1 Tax=Scleropages formosus TaxID=113540 RepID=A0A0P7WGC9_SCLFO|nr:hypothetical protein Z043_121857 [Scleropages formosus]
MRAVSGRPVRGRSRGRTLAGSRCTSPPGCETPAELTAERAHSAMQRVFDTLRGVASARAHLKQLRSVYHAGDGVHQVSGTRIPCRPALVRLLLSTNTLELQGATVSVQVSSGGVPVPHEWFLKLCSKDCATCLFCRQCTPSCSCIQTHKLSVTSVVVSPTCPIVPCAAQHFHLSSPHLRAPPSLGAGGSPGISRKEGVSGHAATYRPFLKQLLEEIYQGERADCPDVEHVSAGITELLKTGFSMFMKYSAVKVVSTGVRANTTGFVKMSATRAHINMNPTGSAAGPLGLVHWALSTGPCPHGSTGRGVASQGLFTAPVFLDRAVRVQLVSPIPRTLQGHLSTAEEVVMSPLSPPMSPAETSKVLVLSTRLLKPTDVPELLFSKDSLAPDISI